MRLVIIGLMMLFVVSCQQTPNKVVTMKQDVAVLAADKMGGRQTGTPGELLAAAYIIERFSAIGLTPKGSEGLYTQTFSFTPSANPHEQSEFTNIQKDGSVTGTNVIGYINNNATTTVIIGAHYDHLGMGGEGSLDREKPAIHNGADDNASGIAILLALAEKLKNQSPTITQNNYLFMAFSGEEMGLLGSNYFVKTPTIDTKKVSYMMNMDMVGRLNKEQTLAVYGVGTSSLFKQTLFANNDQGLTIKEHASGVGPSDHTSFYLADIPVLHFFTGQHADYHKPGDDPEKLNYEGMERISNYILNIVTDLDDAGQLVFKKTKNESEEVPMFKVALGVVPDYLFNGQGMRIDGISEGKPAQQAELQRGDIVVKLGTIDTPDMMSYMKALASFEVGATTTVTVNRDGVLVERQVTF